MTRSPITTHVLDLSRGLAASHLPVSLEWLVGSEWKSLAQSKTNSDGRVEDLLKPGSKAEKGTYRLTFDTKTYFEAQKASECFYPSVSVMFQLDDSDRHHHIPLLLSPFGYSTYRGT